MPAKVRSRSSARTYDSEDRPEWEIRAHTYEVVVGLAVRGDHQASADMVMLRSLH